MSEYNCFNCGKIEHTSDLNRVEFGGLVSLLCDECMGRIFVEVEEEK